MNVNCILHTVLARLQWRNLLFLSAFYNLMIVFQYTLLSKCGAFLQIISIYCNLPFSAIRRVLQLRIHSPRGMEWDFPALCYRSGWLCLSPHIHHFREWDSVIFFNSFSQLCTLGLALHKPFLWACSLLTVALVSEESFDVTEIFRITPCIFNLHTNACNLADSNDSSTVHKLNK